MTKLVISGSRKPINGCIPISGSKNGSFPLMVLPILCSTSCTIENIPYVQDIFDLLNIHRMLGTPIVVGNNTVTIEPMQQLSDIDFSKSTMSNIRGSILFIGPTLARFGKVLFTLPGGCAIGQRPVNLHFDFFKSIGALLEEKSNGTIEATIPKDGLRPTEFTFSQVTVTGTANAVMTSVLIPGTTVLHNCAKEPEIQLLISALSQLGAHIESNDSSITITGSSSLLHGGTIKNQYDRIELATFLGLCAGRSGEITLSNINTMEDILPVLNVLEDMGCHFSFDASKQELHCKAPKQLLPVNITTGCHPYFPTDAQPIISSILTIANGTSTVKETIFESRFKHVAGLKAMGADIDDSEQILTIKGVEHLNGTSITATDLRCGASYVITGSIAEGQTIVNDIYHIDRGYESIEQKCSKLGVDIKRVN